MVADLAVLTRNRDVAEAVELLIGCPAADQEWPGSGTWYTINYVRERGVPLLVLSPSGRILDDTRPPRQPIAGEVPVDHPGVAVPSPMRSWSVPWHGYKPVDITPPQLRPEGLAASVAAGWAEPYASPDDVPDWPERRAAALIPYEVDERWWPLNPDGRTGRAGRNLGKWGENAAADPIVVAGSGKDRRVLLIQRRDRRVWAIPGGMVDPGETAPAALGRELLEETGVDLADVVPTILARSYVQDWRNTDHAWVCSTVALYQLPVQLSATAGDDAVDARWFSFADLDQLATAAAAAGGDLYEAHRPLLATALDRLSRAGRH